MVYYNGWFVGVELVWWSMKFYLVINCNGGLMISWLVMLMIFIDLY